MSIPTLNVTTETYRWPSNLFSIVVQHSSTIKYEEPSFPVGSQVWRSFWKITLTNGLNLEVVHHEFNFLFQTVNLLWISSVLVSYLAFWSWLHNCLDLFMWTSANCLYSITIIRIIQTIYRRPTFPVYLPFVLMHPLYKRSLFLVCPFSWLLCISKNLKKNLKAGRRKTFLSIFMSILSRRKETLKKQAKLCCVLMKQSRNKQISVSMVGWYKKNFGYNASNKTRKCKIKRRSWSVR
jgi:hypothetical protein